MNELKTEDVMKALEEWIYNFKGTANQFCTLCDAITLLREKDAEIEGLKLDIEVLDADLSRYTESVVQMCEATRAKAITEFAERLKKYYDALKSGLVSYHIDQIAKEMREKT